MKFMVVDDSMVIREKIQNVLNDEDFEELKPRVMTLDITMPLMDGIETIKEIMSIDENVRILVVSALADKSTLIQAMHLGAYGFLCKPFRDIELIEAVEELIEDIT